MSDTSQFKVTKKHPLLKKGILIDFLPYPIWKYSIYDGKNHFEISQSTIDHWRKKGYIKDIKS